MLCIGSCYTILSVQWPHPCIVCEMIEYNRKRCKNGSMMFMLDARRHLLWLPAL